MICFIMTMGMVLHVDETNVILRALYNDLVLSPVNLFAFIVSASGFLFIAFLIFLE